MNNRAQNASASVNVYGYTSDEALPPFQCLPPFLVGINSERIEFAPVGANSFPLRVDPFERALLYQEVTEAVYKKFIKIAEEHGGIHIHLKVG